MRNRSENCLAIQCVSEAIRLVNPKLGVSRSRSHTTAGDTKIETEARVACHLT